MVPYDSGAIHLASEWLEVHHFMPVAVNGHILSAATDLARSRILRHPSDVQKNHFVHLSCPEKPTSCCREGTNTGVRPKNVSRYRTRCLNFLWRKKCFGPV